MVICMLPKKEIEQTFCFIEQLDMHTQHLARIFAVKTWYEYIYGNNVLLYVL